MANQTIFIREASHEDETVIAEHLCQIALELDLPTHSIREDWLEKTRQFIDRARHELQYKGFIAELNHQVIGSANCQRLELYPMVSNAYQKGYIWGIYVEPAYRRQGIATQLMNQTARHLKAIGCTHAILHASETGKLIYASVGYQESNEMVLNLESI